MRPDTPVLDPIRVAGVVTLHYADAALEQLTELLDEP